MNHDQTFRVVLIVGSLILLPITGYHHPFYDALALCVLANALVAANWFLFVTGGLLLVLIILRTRKEEEKLLSRFGYAYQTYMEQTGRFLPRIGAR